MQELFLYLIKMVASSGVLLIYYFLFLRDKKFHQYNRFYLLLSVIISFILPLMNIPVSWTGEVEDAPLYIQTLDAMGTVVSGSAGDVDMSIKSLVVPVYVFISVLVFLALFISVYKVYSTGRKYSSEQIGNIIFYDTEEKDAPYSFMNRIFWSKRLELNSEKGQLVFRHELYHVMQLHSADLVFMQLILAVAWVNPFFYIIKKELATIHEFLADQFAVSENDHYSYAEFLVLNAMKPAQTNLITHRFFNSSLKRRIAMILPDNKTTRLSYVARIMSIPLVMVLFCTLALRAEISVKKMIYNDPPEIEQYVVSENAVRTDTVIKPKVKQYVPPPKLKKPVDNKLKIEDTIPVQKLILKDEGPTFTRTEIEAQYPGGLRAWRMHMNKTLIFPKEGVEELEKLYIPEAAVVVQFVVDKDGSLSKIKAISGPEKGGFKEEAERVVKLSGTWTPAIQNGYLVRAYKNQTITFKLESQ